MNSTAQRYLLNMRPDRSYVIPDKDAELYLTDRGFCEYQKPGLRFILLTPKGAAYAERERRWMKNGRTA
jgi:hypothetical protein